MDCFGASSLAACISVCGVCGNDKFIWSATSKSFSVNLRFFHKYDCSIDTSSS